MLTTQTKCTSTVRLHQFGAIIDDHYLKKMLASDSPMLYHWFVAAGFPGSPSLRESIVSAFLLSQKHINALALAMVRAQDNRGQEISFYYPAEERFVRMNPQECVNELLRANLESIDARYGKEKGLPVPAYVYDQFAPFNFEPVQVLKLANCFEYQACEADAWKASLAHAIIQVIVGHFIRRLPGYDEAEWCIA